MAFRDCPNCGFEACKNRRLCGEASKLYIDETIQVVAAATLQGKEVKIKTKSESEEMVAQLAKKAGELLAKWLR